MKTIHPLNFLLAALAILLVSCSKEQSINAVDQTPIEQQLKFLTVAERTQSIHSIRTKEPIIIVSWDEWGRASKNCKGWGLCKATWFPGTNEMISDPGTGTSSILDYDNAVEKYFFDILLSTYPPANLQPSDLDLRIDYDIALDTGSFIGNDLRINRGTYPFDRTLGNYGGYRIYMDKI